MTGSTGLTMCDQDFFYFADTFIQAIIEGKLQKITFTKVI